jgi:hypothetical protein
MIDIASSLLASVTGGFEDGVGLQPGATEGTRNPIIHPRGRKVGCVPERRAIRAIRSGRWCRSSDCSQARSLLWAPTDENN